MKRRHREAIALKALILTALIVGASGPAQGQHPDYVLWTEPERASCSEGETIRVRVLLEILPGATPVKGWSFGVCHDEKCFKFVDVVAGAATLEVCDKEPVSSFEVFPGGVTATTILGDPDDSVCVLQPGCPYELAVITYECTKTIEDTSGQLCLCDDLGNQVPIRVLLSNREQIAPTVTCEPQECRPAEQTCDCTGTDFWLAFPGNFEPQPAVAQDLRLLIASEPGASGQVEVPGIGFWEPFNVPPSGVVEIKVPHSADLGRDSDVVTRLGVHVSSNNPVQVHGVNRVPYTVDGFLGLPTTLLGREYIVLGYKNVHAGSREALNGSQFAVVGCEDNTEVSIEPSVKTNGHAAGLAYTIVLNEGETYQLSNHDDPLADLSGTIITSTRPVGVFGSHFCATVPDGSAFFCNHNVEQLPPTKIWGRQFLAMPFKTRSGGDTFRVLAQQDATSIQVNGALAAVINRGQVFEIEQVASKAIAIAGDRPILVAQHARGSLHDGVADADSSMMLIQPVDQYRDRYLVMTPGPDFQDLNFVNLIVPGGAVGTITVDGVAIPAGLYTAGIGGTGFAGASVSITPGVAHVITGPTLLGLQIYGFDDLDAYAFPGCVSFEGRAGEQIGGVTREIEDAPCDDKPAVVTLFANNAQRSVTVTETLPPCARVVNPGQGQVGENTITLTIPPGQAAVYTLDVSACCAVGVTVDIDGEDESGPCPAGVLGVSTIDCCMEECDTHCEGLDVVVEGGTVGVFASGLDDSGEQISYTFVATDGTDTITIGPQPDDMAVFELETGEWTISVTVSDGSNCQPPAPDATCTTTLRIGVTRPFSRGDGNDDLVVNLSDVVFGLDYLFRRGPTPPCVAAADMNGDSKVDVADPIFLLIYLFRDGPGPPSPTDCVRSAEEGDNTLGCEESLCP